MTRLKLLKGRPLTLEERVLQAFQSYDSAGPPGPVTGWLSTHQIAAKAGLVSQWQSKGFGEVTVYTGLESARAAADRLVRKGKLEKRSGQGTDPNHYRLPAK